MNEQPRDLPALTELLGALRDRTITDEQVEQLDRWLAADPAARGYYLEYVEVCAALLHRQGRFEARQEAAVPPAAPGPQPRGRQRGLLAATILLGLVGAGWYLSRPAQPVMLATRPEDGEPSHSRQRRAVAILSEAINAVWAGPQAAPVVGGELGPGRLQLRSGIVQLEFYCGAQVIAEGPADFEIFGSDRVYCTRGKLRARVMPQAQGFTISSPAVRLVDRGTEFGINVDAAGGAEVHVFQGKVELHEADHAGGLLSAKPELVTGGGLRIAANGDVSDIPADSSAFVSLAGLERQVRQERQRRRQEWLDASRARRADPRLLLYYTFENQPRRERRLSNQAHPGTLDATIIGCEWSEGRWPGKGALDFKRPSDRLRIQVPGTFDSLTFLAWVRVDAFEHYLNSLLLTDGHDEGEPHWQLTEKGQLRLGIKGPPGSWKGYGWHDYDSPAIIRPDRLGQWVQLATVYDRGAGEVVHYLDGHAVSREPIQVSVALRVGDGEIGNWEVDNWDGRIRHLRYAVRNFNGRIDEFALLGEALTAEEIQRWYERGKPGS